MALTVALKTPIKFLGQSQPYGTVLVEQVAQITYDNSYPATGYPISASSFGMNSVLGVVQIATSAGATPTLGQYDGTNGTWRVYVDVASPTTGVSLSATLSLFAEVNVGAAYLNNVSPTVLVLGF